MKKKIIIIIVAIATLLTFIWGTYAWFDWVSTSEEHVNVSVNVRGVEIMYFHGPDILGYSPHPVASKEDGLKKDISVYLKEVSPTDVTINFYLDIVTLANELRDESFKYEFYCNDVKIIDGNFEGTSVGEVITLVSNQRVRQAEDVYSLYLWIDGNMDNPLNMQNKNFKFTLRADGQNAIFDAAKDSEIQKYYKELTMIADKVKEISNNQTGYLGTLLGSSNAVQIRGINFGSGWYFLSRDIIQSQLSINIDVARSSGFVVSYDTGEVLSVDGKMINNEPVHSINYVGAGLKQLYMYGLLSGIDVDSTRSNTKIGEFLIPGGNGLYDELGGLQLGTQAGELAIDQSRPVNTLYSVNATVKGIIPQTNIETFPRTIVAISDTSGSYLSWIGIRNKYLHVYSFYGSSARPNIDYEETIPGFTSIDLTPYNLNDEYMNIQVTAERNQLTRLYINGVLIKTFQSGTAELTYGKITIGDLRSGRNLRYNGNLYNFALYAAVLDDEAVAHNWAYTKKQLGLS